MNGMQSNKILRYSIIAGIFLVPFISFLITGKLFFPFITGKNFAFRILIELVAVLWIILAMRDRSYLPKRNILFGSALLFLVVITVADILGANFFRSFWSNFERMEGLIVHLHLFVYFVLVATVLKRENLWIRFFQTSVAASVIMAIYGILQIAGYAAIHQGTTRLDGSFGNATYLAVYMLFHIFITLFLFGRSRGQKYLQICYACALLLQLFTLYYTATRGSMLGLILGIGLWALLGVILQKENKTARKISLGVIAGLIVIAGGFFLARKLPFVKNSPVLSRFTSISASDSGTKARFLVWGSALRGFKENPILGFGQENFNIVFNQKYNPEMYAQEQWFDRTHNVILDWLISGGILGLLAYLSIFASALFVIWKKTSALSLGEKGLFTALLVGYFFHNLFVFDNLVSYILFFSVLGYLISVDEKEGLLIGEKLVAKMDEARAVVVPALVVVGFIVLYFFNGRQILTSYYLIKALSVQSNLNSNLQYFEKALAYNSQGRDEVREQLVQATSRVAAANVDPAIQRSFIALAREEMQKYIEESPEDARPLFFLGTFLDGLRLYSEAYPYLEKAEQKSPNKQQILFEMGINLINRGKQDEGLAILKRAYELTPRHVEGQVVYAAALIYSGDTKTAQKLLVESQGLPYSPDDRVIAAYYATGQFKSAIESLKLKILQSPTDGNAHLSLATVYVAAGMKEAAVEEIKLLMAGNPNFRAEGEKIIEQIRAGKKVQ